MKDLNIFIIGVVVLIGLIFLDAWVFLKIWKWFAASFVFAINYKQAVGIVMVAKALRNSSSSKLQDLSFAELIMDALIQDLVRLAMMLVTSYIIHQII